jgi:hypothetical protein
VTGTPAANIPQPLDVPLSLQKTGKERYLRHSLVGYGPFAQKYITSPSPHDVYMTACGPRYVHLYQFHAIGISSIDGTSLLGAA